MLKLKKIIKKSSTHKSRRIVLVTFLLLSIVCSSTYAQFSMGNTLAPLPGNPYPIINANDAKGGHHQVATIAARNAITSLRRIPGMLCTVLDAGSGTPKTYQLLGGILDANWVEFTTGSASTVTTNANLTGDVTSVGNATTLANSGVTAGTYNNLVVNTKGLVTTGSTVSYPKWYGEYSFNNSMPAITTSAFISILSSLGAFTNGYWCSRGSWSYGANAYINDAGYGNIHLAGATVEVIGTSSNYTIRIHTPTTDGIGGQINCEFIYVNNATGYSPGWRKILNDKNFNAYAPTLTGGNATGNWGINITGNAATATTATNWAGSVNYLPLTGGTLTGALNGTAVYLTDGLTITHNYRQKISHGDNHALILEALSNAQGTGDAGLYTWISEPGMSWTGAGIARNMINATAFPRVNTSLSGQMINFDEGGGINFVLESTLGARCSSLYLSSANATFSGNVTAFSDIRLKKNIHILPNVSESLRKIDAVEFDRKDIKAHQLGFIAQNVQKYFPDLVSSATDSIATLSLNYQAMTSPLLKGWQEHDEIIIKQQKEIDDLIKQITVLKQAQKEIDDLKKQVAVLKQAQEEIMNLINSKK